VALVTLKNVYKYYFSKKEKVEAVRNLNLEIEDKEIVALLGPSGCGKTSTLRMIAGLEEISSGELYIDKLLSNDLTPSQRNIALAFEDYALYFHLTVRENMELCLKAKKLRPEVIKKKVKDVSQMLGIDDILDSRTNALSGGQQQRVSLARALVRDPSIFLLDEPISHVEVEKRYQILASIKEINYEFGTTMLYVTHNQVEAIAVGNRIGVMNFAELQQIGSKEEIFNKPVNIFVASFVGQPQINLLDCEVGLNNGEIFLKAKNGKLSFIPESKVGKEISQLNLKEVVLGLRPQDISIRRIKSEQKSIIGVIEIIEFLGEYMHIVLKSGDCNFSVYCGVDMGLKKGKEMELFYDQSRLHIFNPETEKAICV
jgi:multiple sugar transport system ATP-binding protein